jgi:hypothetical protein
MGVLLFFRLWYRVVLLLALATVTVIILYRVFRYLRGARNRDGGIRCLKCQATAFPLEGSTRSYRCRGCGSHFKGLEHF